MQRQPNARGGYMDTKTPSMSERTWLTVPEVADELHIPRTRAYELIQKGELPAVRIGERSIRVNRRELETFLTETRRVVAG
jgi:excisionase family DNA binding protein